MRRAAAPAAGSAAAATPVALFASVEDPALLRGPALRDFNLSSLASLGAAASAARREHGLTLPDGIAASPSRAPCHRPGSAQRRARPLRLLGAHLVALGTWLRAPPGRRPEARLVPPPPAARDLAAQPPHQVTDPLPPLAAQASRRCSSTSSRAHARSGCCSTPSRRTRSSSWAAWACSTRMPSAGRATSPRSSRGGRA